MALLASSVDFPWPGGANAPLEEHSAIVEAIASGGGGDGDTAYIALKVTISRAAFVDPGLRQDSIAAENAFSL